MRSEDSERAAAEVETTSSAQGPGPVVGPRAVAGAHWRESRQLRFLEVAAAVVKDFTPQYKRPINIFMRPVLTRRRAPVFTS
jgi:hypothetical protein